jgi:hypothetical protein
MHGWGEVEGGEAGWEGLGMEGWKVHRPTKAGAACTCFPERPSAVASAYLRRHSCARRWPARWRMRTRGKNRQVASKLRCRLARGVLEAACGLWRRASLPMVLLARLHLMSRSRSRAPHTSWSTIALLSRVMCITRMPTLAAEVACLEAARRATGA